jgi:hypothetical protein
MNLIKILLKRLASSAGYEITKKVETLRGDARLACKLVRQRRFGSSPRGFNDKLVYPKLKY